MDIEKIMNLKTEQDTFDKLRRSSYNAACVAYTMACMSNNLPSTATIDEMNETAKDALGALGWTHEDLSAYDMKQRDRQWQN